MRTVASLLASPFRRDLVAGGVAGLAGGLLFWWALQVQGMALAVPGLLGFTLSGAGVSIDYTFQVKAKLPQLKKAGEKGKKS